MKSLVCVVALLTIGGCEKSEGRRVRVQILNVPAGITMLRARIVLDNRQQEHAWSGNALQAVMAGSTELTIGLDDNEAGPLEVRVDALSGACTLATQTTSCLSVAAESCRSLMVMLPNPMPCMGPGMDGRDPDAGVIVPTTPDMGVEDLWDGRCSDGGSC